MTMTLYMIEQNVRPEQVLIAHSELEPQFAT